MTSRGFEKALKNGLFCKKTQTNALNLLLVSTALTCSTAAVAQENNLLDEVVVTASASEVTYKNAPASISVITAEELENQGAKDVRSLLESVEGLTFNRAGNQSKVQIRGLNENYTLFLIDGKRVTSAPNAFRGNDYDSGWVPLEAVERIEIVRGPMSSLYGSDAIGGVVNIITKKETEEWHGSLTTEYTLQENRKSGDYGRTGFNVSGPLLKDKLFMRTYGSWDFRRQDSGSLNPDSPSGGANAGFAKSDNKYIDTTVTWDVNEENSLDFNAGYSKRTHDKTTLDRFSGGITHHGSYEFGETELRAFGDRIENSYGHGNTSGKNEPNTAYNFTGDGKVSFDADFVVPQFITIGATYQHQSLEDKHVLTGEGGSYNSIWQASAFLEDRFEISDSFEVTLGGRLDRHERFGWNASPRVYGVYHLTDALTFKGGWSSSFKAPTLLQLSPGWQQISCGGNCYLVGAEDLNPEVGSSFEAGFKYDEAKWSAGITGFHNTIKDMIPFPPARTPDAVAAKNFSNYVGETPDGKPIFKFQNIEEARTMGVEASLTVRPIDKLTVFANYTYLDAKNISADNAPLAFQPKHSANIKLDYAFSEKLSFALSANYVGEQYTWIPADGNTTFASKVDGYITADFSGRYDVSENFTLRAGVMNIADNQILKEDGDAFNVDGRRYFISGTTRF
ncbi:TonB-dependent receptor domain-containing protein [Pseudovibrio brasiliensis]|uniref:TonB-dependent receptor n=1 Tax=Pseudovibrio brasiliensis TaxID=1898042 RepID=A0ABX8ARQ7_9HYPH|nr:TonB-dependent receptor [Pseudovibrio brasiliensis]QUS57785.1 TonB-dependent receptor [Pseudovibrio brasiliensis]